MEINCSNCFIDFRIYQIYWVSSVSVSERPRFFDNRINTVIWWRLSRLNTEFYLLTENSAFVFIYFIKPYSSHSLPTVKYVLHFLLIFTFQLKTKTDNLPNQVGWGETLLLFVTYFTFFFSQVGEFRRDYTLQCVDFFSFSNATRLSRKMKEMRF